MAVASRGDAVSQTRRRRVVRRPGLGDDRVVAAAMARLGDMFGARALMAAMGGLVVAGEVVVALVVGRVGVERWGQSGRAGVCGRWQRWLLGLHSGGRRWWSR